MKIKPGIVRIRPELHFVVKTMKLYAGFEIQQWVNEAVLEKLDREIGSYPEMPGKAFVLLARAIDDHQPLNGLDRGGDIEERA